MTKTVLLVSCHCPTLATVISISISRTSVTPVQVKRRVVLRDFSFVHSHLQPTGRSKWPYIWNIFQTCLLASIAAETTLLEATIIFSLDLPSHPRQPVWHSKNINQIEELLFLKPFNGFPLHSKSNSDSSWLTSSYTKLAPSICDFIWYYFPPLFFSKHSDLLFVSWWCKIHSWIKTFAFVAPSAWNTLFQTSAWL